MTKASLNRSAAALVALALVAGCNTSSSVPPRASRMSGTIALSLDDTSIYVADADNNQVVVVDAAKQKVLRKVPVGAEPSRVLVASDGRVYVSNRQGRSVSVLDSAVTKEVARIAVGTEPTGLAMTADGKTLLVANTTNASVSLVDIPTLKERSVIATPQDPSGITVLPDGRAYVTHLRTGSVSIIDVAAGTVSSSQISLQLPVATTGGENRLPGQPVAPVLGANGLVYIAHVQSKETATPTTVSNSDAYAGSPGSVSVVAPAVATVDTTTNLVRVGTGFQSAFTPGPCGTCGAPGAPTPPGSASPAAETDIPPSILTVINQPLSGPSAAVVDPSGGFLYIAHMNSNNVAIVYTDPSTVLSTPTTAPVPTTGASGVPSVTQGIYQIVQVGAGPNGIAIPTSADRAYVYNSFDHSISVLLADSSQHSIVAQPAYSIGATSLTPEQDLGRRLFFSAADPRMTDTVAGGIACASCHPSGREDGRTWLFTEGPRNTPTVAGRHLTTTAPYHWDGTLLTMHDFNTIIVNRMGGSGDETAGATAPAPLSESDFNALLAFMDNQTPPDNPWVTPANAASAARGKVLFETTAGCIACHSGPDFTDNLFHNVGTQNTGPGGVSPITGQPELFPTADSNNPTTTGVNTPTLHNLFITMPYFHDGSIATIEDRLAITGNQHGTPDALSAAQKADLAMYLRQL